MNVASTIELPVYAVRVYYADTDAGGVAHHTAYLRWFEAARSEWQCAVGCSARELQDIYGVALAVVDATLHYLKPAALDERLLARGNVSAASRCSLLVSQTLMRNETPLAAAEFRLACVNVATQRPAPLPDALKAALSHETCRTRYDMKTGILAGRAFTA